MKYSLAVRDKEKVKQVLGDLYDPDSPFCLYEVGEEVPDGKFLIVISDKPVNLPNVVFYISDISVLLDSKRITDAGFPEEEESVEEEEPHAKEEEKPKIPVEEDVFAVEKKRDKIVEPEPQVEEVKKPVLRKANIEKKAEVKKNVLYVGDIETALTVAVSVHKFRPSMKVVIENAELAEQYGVIDQNLVAVAEDGQGDIVIKVREGENSGFEQYRGQQYSNWQEIARCALSRIR